jgi:hypothetical protein
MTEKRNDKNLVNRIGDVSIDDCYRKLKKAHGIIVEYSRKKIPKLAGFSESAWGTGCKRISVDMPPKSGIPNQRLVETINQCATMERLLALLKWLCKSSEFSRLKIDCCHPTTSSAKNENDLVLVAPATGAKIRFEVWDCAAKKINNNKLVKSLEKLKVFAAQGDRCFLVVSIELASTLENKGYKENKCDDYTSAFEINSK